MQRFSRWLLKKLIQAIIVILLWSCLWSTVRGQSLPPNGNIFWLFILFCCAYCAGEISVFLRAPALLGMLIAGLVLKNATNFHVESHISATLRSVALTVILLRAGLELDPRVIKKLSGVCLRLAIVPCVIETLSAALTTHYFIGLSWKWGTLVGFVLSAVSPAVIVAQMVILTEKKLGTNKGIPTIVIAASSLDDALVITGFGVLLGTIFSSSESLLWQLTEGPLEAILGLLLGSTVGVVLWHIPPSQTEGIENPGNCADDNNSWVGLVLPVLFGLSAVFVTQEVKLSGIGPLAALTLTFVAALRWRDDYRGLALQEGLKTLWTFCEPLLFALIGAEIDISTIETNSIGLCLACLVIGLLLRSLVCFMILWGAKLTMKEKLFVALALLPKATVQAAIGPVALDMARKTKQAEAIANGTLVLNIAVLAILITAPLGALLTTLTRKKLLKREAKETNGCGVFTTAIEVETIS